MKIKKIIAGVAAAVMACTTMAAMSVFPLRITTVPRD